MCGRYEIRDGKRIWVRFKVANAAPAMLPNLDVGPNIAKLTPGAK